MPQTDPRTDAYIAAAAPFAQPILTELRRIVHAACPDVAETIKWRMPFFVLEGRIVAHMAAFKQHCAFDIWHGRDSAETDKSAEAMGQFGRIVQLADLPDAEVLTALVKEAATRALAGAPRTRKRRVSAAGG